MNSAYFQKTQIELTKLLYQQVRVGLWAESIAALGLAAALWGALDARLLIGWLLFNLIFCGLARHLLFLYFQKANRTSLLSYQQMRVWLFLFGVGALLSGVSWGMTGSLLMIKHDIVRQIFIIILLIGVTAAANALYSANRIVYAVFLFPAFVPFVIWLFMQGGIYSILGVLGIIYIILMLCLAFYSYHFISASLYLRFKNIDLVDHLSNAKYILEKRTKKLEKTLSLVKATLDATTDAILVVDSNNRIDDFNQKFIDMWHLPVSLIENKDIYEFVEQVHRQLENPGIFIEKILELADHPEEASYDELLFKDGRVFERYSNPQRLGDKFIGRVWSFRDVTGRKTLEAKLFQKANFDLLTGLPNRSLLLDRASQAIAYAKVTKKDMAILFLDVDRFKLINDTLGHMFGDKVLKSVAERLKNCIPENDTVSREGGDEFIIILNALSNDADAINTVRCILENLRKPFKLNDHSVNLTASIGVSFFPKDGVDAEKLIRNADIAMYHAKEIGRDNFQFFTEEMNKKVLKRLEMESELRRALEKKEFYLVYQPIIHVKTGKIISLEALLRWKHAKFDIIFPEDFISLAEETGAIIPIGYWVLRTACQHAKFLHANNFFVQVAVNFSSRQFKQADFLEQVQTILDENQLSPKYLSIELTESVIMADLDKTIEVLKAMKQMGITIAIDDFGTGYSSLNYLKKLPVNKLKIDRSFIQDIPHQTDAASITAAIIALANKLNLIVIAEGVEEEEQLKFLMKHRCDEMQGFYFSSPIAAKGCLQLLEENQLSPFLSVLI